MEKLDGITNGTAAASKAVVLDGSKNIATLGTVGCGAITSTGASSFGSISSVAAITATGVLSSSAQISGSSFWGDGAGLTGISSDNVDVANTTSDLNYQLVAVTASGDGVNLVTLNTIASRVTINGSDGKMFLSGPGIQIGAADVSEAEFEFLDGASAGTVVNSKAVVYSAAGKVQGTTFLGPDDMTIGGATVNDMITIGSDEVVFKDGAYNVNIASHDGSNGLELGGTLVTSTAAELNYVDVTAGTATLSKALVLDADLAIGTILNLTASAAKFTTVDINGGAIDGAVIGAASAVSGTFTGVVATSLSISDGAISNVSDISLDTISADGSSFSFASNWTAASRTCADLGSVTTADINGGTIDGTTIGVASAAVVTASYLAVNGNVDLGDGSDIINVNGRLDFGGGASANMQRITSADSLTEGDFYNIVSGSGAVTVTLPGNSGLTDGTIFYIKRGYGMTNNVTVTVADVNAEMIDGDSSIVLESALAAVQVFWDSTAGNWAVF